MKVCSKCGKQYNDNGTFCNLCGGMLTTIDNPNTSNAVKGNFTNPQFNNVGANYQPNVANNNMNANYQPNMVNKNASSNYQPNMTNNNMSANCKSDAESNGLFPLNHVLNLSFDLMAVLSFLFIVIAIKDVSHEFVATRYDGYVYEVFDDGYATAVLIFAIVATIVSVVNLVLIILKRFSIKEMCPIITRILISIAFLICAGILF